MQNWEFLPLMAIGMGLIFWTLHYFGLMVVKSGTYTGGAMGTSTRFWGEYRPAGDRLRQRQCRCTWAEQGGPVYLVCLRLPGETGRLPGYPDL